MASNSLDKQASRFYDTLRLSKMSRKGITMLRTIHLPAAIQSQTFTTVLSSCLLITVGLSLAVRPLAESTVYIVRSTRGIITVELMVAVFVACGLAVLWLRPSLHLFSVLHTPLVYLFGLNTGFLISTPNRPLFLLFVYAALLVALWRLRRKELYGTAAAPPSAA